MHLKGLIDPKELPPSFKPERMSDSALQIIPLGGLGEFGMNMMAYRYEDEIVVVDCGGMFPDHSLMGVDFVIPDMDFLQQNKEYVRALIITHGHEDHIGATPYFIRDIGAPVYATPFTVNLLRSKLEEWDLPGANGLLNTIEADGDLHFNHFHFQFLHVNHSILQAVSLAIDTPEGLIVHTGDFKIDANPIDGRVFDYSGFAWLGSRGVLALLSDSTNVERPGFSGSENEVVAELDDIFGMTRSRIFVTLFASSVARIQEVLKLAKRYGRKVHISGRSMLNTTGIAREMGLMSVDPDMLIAASDVDSLPPEKVVVVMTGSQGEPRSVLSRVAMNDHKEIHIREGDVVVISARVIPGHERSVSNVINHLAMHGARVFYEGNRKVHASGHAYAGELSTMLNLTKPKHFIPLHGDYHLLRSHGELAKDCGVAPQNVTILTDGEILQFSDGAVEKVGKAPIGRILIDGNGVGEVGPGEIRERRKISQTGIVVAILIFRKSSGEILFGPELISKGFLFEDMNEDLFEQGRKFVLEMMHEMNIETKADLEEVKEQLRIAVRRYFNKAIERKPVVIPIVMAM